MNKDILKNTVEGFLFASDKPLSVEQLVKLFPEGDQPQAEEIEQSIESLIADFETHGIELKKVKTGYRFQVKQETASWVARLWDEKPAKYTRAMLETLALIVYRQPITRGEIENIRGVSVSSHIIRTMVERDWVKVIGHRDVPGRPALYASTKEFLDYFNLSSLEELPPLSEIKDLDSIATELDPEQNAALISAIREMQKENVSDLDELPMTDNVEVDQESPADHALAQQDNQHNEGNEDSNGNRLDAQITVEYASNAPSAENENWQQALIDKLTPEPEELSAHSELSQSDSATDPALYSEQRDAKEAPKSFSDLVSNFGKTDQNDDAENIGPASDEQKNSVESDAK